MVLRSGVEVPRQSVSHSGHGPPLEQNGLHGVTILVDERRCLLGHGCHPVSLAGSDLCSARGQGLADSLDIRFGTQVASEKLDVIQHSRYLATDSRSTISTWLTRVGRSSGLSNPHSLGSAHERSSEQRSCRENRGSVVVQPSTAHHHCLRADGKTRSSEVGGRASGETILNVELATRSRSPRERCLTHPSVNLRPHLTELGQHLGVGERCRTWRPVGHRGSLGKGLAGVRRHAEGVRPGGRDRRAGRRP